MGAFVDLKCPKSKYEFSALFWNGGSGRPDEEALQRLVSGDRKDEASLVYALMKSLGDVRVEADSKPFACEQCREIFNYYRVIIHGKEGQYIETSAVCPVCGGKVPSYQGIGLSDLEGKEKNTHGECLCRCPKCSHRLRVTGNGNSSGIDGTSSERIAKVLSPKAKKIIYNEDGTIACGDFENDDLKATLRINKNTITETLHWFGERRIPFVATERIMMDADVLLKNAKYIGSREDYLPENKGQNIHYLVSPAKENGSNKAILFTLHDVPQKSLGYNEHVYTVGMSFIAEQKQNGGPQDHVGSEAQTMDLTAETTSDVTITDVLRSVNTDRIRLVGRKVFAGSFMRPRLFLANGSKTGQNGGF